MPNARVLIVGAGPTGLGARPVADPPESAGAPHRPGGGARHHLAGARRSGAHARALRPDPSGPHGRRPRPPRAGGELLGRGQAARERDIRRSRRRLESLSLRPGVPAGRARAAADRSPGRARRRGGARLRARELRGIGRRRARAREASRRRHRDHRGGLHCRMRRRALGGAHDARHRIRRRHLCSPVLRRRRASRGGGDRREHPRRPRHERFPGGISAPARGRGAPGGHGAR